MTKTELFDIWERYMHRNDLSADLDTTYTLASERITERLLSTTVDLATILADSPRMFVHAGLCSLHELAQDDEGLTREEAKFEQAVQDYALRNSINNVTPAMRPYYRSFEDAS